MKNLYQENSLKLIIDEFYQVFNYPAPKNHLNVCLFCCVLDETEMEMRTLPLHKLTHKHFYEYNSSAKDEKERPNEIKYFLPRMVEIFSKGEKINFETELSFERIKNCSKESFTTQEWILWDKFANVYLDTLLKYYPYECFDCVNENIFDVVLMFGMAHIDIKPFLQRWRDTDTYQAIAHYIHASWSAYWCNNGFDEHSDFWDYSDDFLQKMEEWIENPNNKNYFFHKIKQLDKNIVQEIRDLGDFYPDYIEKLLAKLS